MKKLRARSVLWLVLVMASVPLMSATEGNVNASLEIPGFVKEVCRVSRMVLVKCWHKANLGLGQLKNDRGDVLIAVQECLKRASLVALERMVVKEIIQLPFGVRLVRNSSVTSNKSLARTSSGDDWRRLVMQKVARILRTHTLQLPVGNLIAGRRRHKHQETSVILFGIMAMLIIAIPLGFQFLAVLGGKALLLAKMALILSSIQGLKKIATSDVNYGLYSAAHGKPWFYDRKSQHPHIDFHGPEAYDIPDQEMDAFFHLKPRRSMIHN